MAIKGTPGRARTSQRLSKIAPKIFMVSRMLYLLLLLALRCTAAQTVSINDWPVEHLIDVAVTYKETYRRAVPFPHVALDGLFPKQMLDAVEKEVSESQDGRGCSGGVSRCRVRHDARTRQPLEVHKGSIQDEAQMGPGTKLAFAFMKSSRVSPA